MQLVTVGMGVVGAVTGGVYSWLAYDAYRPAEASRHVHASLVERVKLPLEKAYDERLRQARVTFNVAVALTVVGVGVILVGVVMSFFGQLAAGTITAAGGTLSQGLHLPLAKMRSDANDRYDKLIGPLAKDAKVTASSSQSNRAQKGISRH